MADEWTKVPPVRPLTGAEEFIGIEATVTDFWRFAISDLKMNNVRGYLAEFLVAQAVGAVGQRVEWDAFDVETPTGIKIEVKSSAYIQAWDQRRPSNITFSGLRGRTWDARTGESPEATYNADVYVFCVETAKTHDAYDPLDTTQWQFYVAPMATIAATGYKSIGLPTLSRLTGGPITYADLAVAISTASHQRG